MYDEIINGISYSMSGDSSYLGSLIFDYCQYYSIPFFGLLGIMLGVKFLKDSFR